MNLSDVSLLAVLNISQWTARKYDKEATKQIAIKHGIDSAVGRYNKSLLPMTDELKAITNNSVFIRDWYYENTLPYTYEGVRILPSRRFFEFMQQWNKLNAHWHFLTDTFLSHYPEHVTNAEVMLGPLYDTNDYPTVLTIRDYFKINMHVSPVPNAKGFYDVLAQDMAAGMAEELVKSSQEAMQKAMQECWVRLYNIVHRFSAKLAADSASLREDHVQSMLDNARELCILLEHLNMADDANLEAMRLEVEKQLCKYSAAVLSSHDLSKNEVKASADEIMRKMSAFMGGS